MKRQAPGGRATRVLSGMCLAVVLGGVGDASAQGTGTVRGTLRSAADQTPVAGASVGLSGSQLASVSDPLGRFVLPHVPAGRHTLTIRAIGFRLDSVTVLVQAGGAAAVDVVLEPAPVRLSEIVVRGASRLPETVLRAPAAVTRVPAGVQRDYGPTGQVPQALIRIPGIDAVQTGVNDWNVAARGFNTTNARRVLVLLDGRDLALAFLGSQEWPALSIALEDLGSIEFVRGPGSALYGPNAFSGVLNLTSPSAREVAGTRVSLAGGMLSSFQGGVRHAGVLGDGRWGYRVHAGYVRSDTWARSRTDLGDLAREYADAIDTVRFPIQPPAPGFETVPLNGQTTSGAAGAPSPALGGRDAVTRVYGGARVDYYARAGTFTAEVGHSINRNESMVTGAGRIQIGDALRPWARVGWESERFRTFAYYSGRISTDQVNLTSGANIEETSAILHGEAQYNRPLLGGRGHLVVGASSRALLVDSKNTLLPPSTDDRVDRFVSGYGQLEYDVLPTVRLLAAARVDGGNLFDTEISPKAAIVWRAHEHHALRATVNRAFKTPVMLEYFLEVPAGPPADFSDLEAALRASPLGPALAGVPDGQLFTTSAAVPVLALGNENLKVEHNTSWEVGWKGQLTPRVFVTADLYYARLSDFVTELLPGVNPTYGPWTAPPAVAEQDRETVETAVRDALIAAGQPFAAAALTRLPNEQTAMVVSVGNAGRATDYGVEVGASALLPAGFGVDVNYTYFNFDVDATSLVPAQQILPNTPRHKANLAVSYTGSQGLDVRLAGRWVSGFDWVGGVFVGRVPALQTVDVIAGYRFTTGLRAQLTATNVFDQRRYQAFGGPVVGRRVLAGLTATF